MIIEQTLSESGNSLDERSTEGGSGHQGTRGSLEGVRRLISAQKQVGARAPRHVNYRWGFGPVRL